MAQPMPVFGMVDAFGQRRSGDEVRIIREMLEEDIKVFMADSGTDGPAARELLSEPPEIQWVVMQRGPVRSATNPSAALIGRIRDAKSNINRPGGNHGPLAMVHQEPGKPLNEIERFIMDNKLDVSAASSLRSEQEGVQKTVIMQGPLVNCRSPSGALMARIKAARDGKTVYRPGGQTVGTPALPPPGVPPGAPPMGLPGGAPMMGGPMMGGPMGGPMMGGPMMGGPMMGGPMMGPPPGGPPGVQPSPPLALEAGPAPSLEDSKLNEEAMKAIAMLNANNADGPAWSEI